MKTARSKLYEPSGHGTLLDSLVEALRAKIGALSELKVSGLTSRPRRNWSSAPTVRGISEQGEAWSQFIKIGFDFPAEDVGVDALRESFQRIYGPDALATHFEDWLKYVGLALEGRWSDIVREFSDDSEFHVGFRRSGACSIWISLWLQITPKDALLFRYSGVSDVIRTYLDEAAALLARKVRQDRELPQKLIEDATTWTRLQRTLENSLRRSRSRPTIGNTHLAETRLYRELSRHFPALKREHSPRWLQGQRFDFYIPELKVAVEYHGEQHYRPIAVFGGEEGFRETVERDLAKTAKAEANGVAVAVWKFDQGITPSMVAEFAQRLRTSRSA